MSDAIQAGQTPHIGVRAMCGMHTGWTVGDGSGHDGYSVADYFDGKGRYRGADKHGIEPIFRDLTAGEASAYLDQDAGMEAGTKYMVKSTLDDADGIDYEYLYGTEERDHATRAGAEAVAAKLNETAEGLDWGAAETPKYSVMAKGQP